MNYGGYVMRVLQRALLIASLTTTLYPSSAQAFINDVSPEQVVELIKWRAQVHNAPVELMLSVAYCESKYDPNAVGKLGERGIFQWLPGPNAWIATTAYKISQIDIQERYKSEDINAVFYDIDSAAELFASPIMRRIHWASTLNRKC
jgi:Transglycosylase SLT domain